MAGLNSFLPNFEQPEAPAPQAQPESNPAVDYLGTAQALGGDKKLQQESERNKPLVTEGVPDMLRNPMPQTLASLNEHPEYQNRAVAMYQYAKQNDNMGLTPDLSDPREIAEWTTKNYAWLEWSDVKKMMDYNKLDNMPPEVLQAWNEGAAMWRNTDGSVDQSLRASVGILTSPLTWLGMGAVRGAAQGVMSKQAFKYFEKLGQKIGRSQSFGMKSARMLGASSVAGAGWAGGDRAYWEKFEAEAEGREFNDNGSVTEAAMMGAVGAPAMIAGGYGVFKGIKAGNQAMRNNVRLYRGSRLGAFQTETGRAGTWTDSQEAAAQFAGGEGNVHVANAYPQRPMIFNQPDYSAQEIIQKLGLDEERGAKLIEATNNEQRIPVKQVVDMVEDDLTAKGVDMAIIREPVDGMKSMYGLEQGSLEKSEIQSYKILNPSIVFKPKGFEPIFVPRSQRGMVGTYYHGSGARHDKFQDKFLRTGEGNTKFGAGVYVAQHKGTGQFYETQMGKKTGEGYLYKTKVKPKEEEFLDWDKPLSKQSSHVKKALASNEVTANYLDNPEILRAHGGADTGEALNTALYSLEGGKEGVADILHSMGIKGNLYLDGGSRFEGEGTHNLVVFKSEDIEIRQRGDQEFKGYNTKEAKQFLMDKDISKNPNEDWGFREEQDYVDLAREHGYEGAPFDPPWKIDKGRVSTRYPSGAKRMQDPHSKELLVGLDGMKLVPSSFETNMGIMSKYPNFKSSAKTASGRAQAMTKHVKDNLLWLHDQIPEDIRNRSKMWYDGANNMANEWSERYQMPDHSIAGIMAVLSPQKDWYMNVSLAERVLDIMSHKKDSDWTDEMFQTGKRVFLDSQDRSTASGRAKYNENANMLAVVAGKKLGELDESLEQAMWLRLYDETYHDRTHRIVTPEGEFGETVMTKGGEQAKTGWGSLGEIEKAVRIFNSPTMHNVSKRLGGMHKVRNFYNNIIDPSNASDVTIDTHAVAAGLLRPLSGKSAEVLHNFGGGVKGQRGASNSTKSGSMGTYGLYADAYRQAAAERGILPREMQSITWEAVRGLYGASYKADDKNVQFIEQVWYDYRKGKITLDEARSISSEHAQGINPPTWHGGRDSVVSEEKAKTSYAGQLHGSGTSGSYLGRTGGRGAGSNTGLPSSGVNPAAMLGATGLGGASALQFIPYSGEGEI